MSNKPDKYTKFDDAPDQINLEYVIWLESELASAERTSAKHWEMANSYLDRAEAASKRNVELKLKLDAALSTHKANKGYIGTNKTRNYDGDSK